MSIPPRPPTPPESNDSGDDFFSGAAVPADPGHDSTQALTQDELAELRRRAMRRGPATPIDSEADEATQMLSIEELRELAAENPGARGQANAAEDQGRASLSKDEARAAAAAAEHQATPGSWPLPVTGQFPATRAQQGPMPPRTAATAPAVATRPAAGAGAPAAGGIAAYAHGSPGGGPPMGPQPPGQAPARQRGSRWWVWLLAVVGILLLAALVILGARAIAIQEPSANPATLEPPPPASATGEATPSASAPASIESFASPTGNITCTIDAERARCTIADHDYEAPEPPEGCSWDGWGSVVVANAEGAGFSCDENGPEAGSPETLGYGESVSAHGMTCTSERDGMTCESDAGGKGFTLSRAAADIAN